MSWRNSGTGSSFSISQRPRRGRYRHTHKSRRIPPEKSFSHKCGRRLDVHAIAAGATNDHIDAAYQPLDDNADDFEYFVGDAIEKILELAGIDDEPQFKRNRISNEKERTDMILEAANYLDEETILKKLPFVAPEEVPDILAKLDEESYNRYTEPIEPDAPEGNPEGDE